MKLIVRVSGYVTGALHSRTSTTAEISERKAKK